MTRNSNTAQSPSATSKGGLSTSTVLAPYSNPVASEGQTVSRDGHAPHPVVVSALISRQGRAYRSTLSAVTSRMALCREGVRNNSEKRFQRYVSQAARFGLFCCQVRFSFNRYE